MITREEFANFDLTTQINSSEGSFKFTVEPSFELSEDKIKDIQKKISSILKKELSNGET